MRGGGGWCRFSVVVPIAARGRAIMSYIRLIRLVLLLLLLLLLLLMHSAGCIRVLWVIGRGIVVVGRYRVRITVLITISSASL